MEHTSDPTDPSTLAAAFNDQAHRTDGACHSSSRRSAVGNGIPITNPRGAIQATVSTTFNPRGSQTSDDSVVDTTTANSAVISAMHPRTLINRPSLFPSTRVLAKLPSPLETSIEKITTINA